MAGRTVVRIAGLFLLISVAFRAVPEPVAAEPAYPDLRFWIHRVRMEDPIDTLSPPSLYYYLGVSQSGTWAWRGPFTLPDGDDVTVNANHTFEVREASPGIAVVLCEADPLGLDDSADLAGDAPGGVDDGGCPLSPGGAPGYGFEATWDLVSDRLTGIPDRSAHAYEAGFLKVSGDFDGSTSADDNDATVWFWIADTYLGGPIAFAGYGETAEVGETVPLAAYGSSASPSATIESYDWDFEDDGTFDASGIVVSTRYAAAGTYRVRLRVTDSLGRTADATVPVEVRARAPVAAFAFAPTAPTTLQTVSFADLSTGRGGPIREWRWEFGDGSVSRDPDPTHRFPHPGRYAVTLTVTDDRGEVGVSRREVVVAPAPPVAAFSYAPAAPSAGTPIRFRDGSIDLDGRIVTWSWDFGDGTTSVEASPSHVYASPGSYVVLLRIADQHGIAATTAVEIVVRAPASPLPEILSAALLGIAFGAIWVLRRRRRVRQPPKALHAAVALAACLASLASLPGGAAAYTEAPPLDAPGSTHQFLLSRAVDILEADGHAALAAYLRGGFLEEMKRGTIRADRTLADSREHYHDPWTHGGFLGFRSAADLGREQFLLAVDAWRAGDPMRAAFHLGWAAHTVQDLTVPHHARLTPLDFHAEYEAFVAANRASAAASSNGTYAFESVLPGHYEDPSDPWDWVDYNAHVAYDYFGNVSSGDPVRFRAAMDVLLPRAQRTTAGFLRMFFETVNAPPVVELAAPASAEIGVPFTASAAVDEDVAVSSVTWRADGLVRPLHRFAAIEFSAPGPHLVEVTVTDALGSATSASAVVAVTSPSPVRAVIEGPTSVAVGEPATFSGLPSNADLGIASYAWFLDGAAAGEGPNLVANFTAPGVHLVEIRVTDIAGATAAATHPVVTEDREPPRVDLPDEVLPGNSVLGYVSAPDLASAAWYVDGVRIESAQLTAEALSSGVHSVALVAVDAAGNVGIDTATLRVVRSEAPAADALLILFPPVAAVVASLVWRWRRRRA